MSVGTTADFDLTRDELIDLSFSYIGVQEASNEDRALAVKVLNLMLRHLDNRGLWVHASSNTVSSLTLVSNQQAYVTGVGANNISASIKKLLYAAVLIGTERYELTRLDKRTSLNTPLLSESNGQPVAVYLEMAKLRASQRMLFYPTPNSAYTVYYNFSRPLYEFDNPTDNPDLQTDYLLALQKFLAAELAPHFGITLNERQIILAEAEKLFKEAQDGTASEPSYVPVKTEYY